MIQIENVNLEGGKIHKKKHASRLEYLKGFSKLPKQEQFLNNKVLPQNKNAWYWNFFRKIDDDRRYFKY